MLLRTRVTPEINELLRKVSVYGARTPGIGPISSAIARRAEIDLPRLRFANRDIEPLESARVALGKLDRRFGESEEGLGGEKKR